MSSQFKRIPSLDGLRAISILLVIIGHARGSLGSIVSENVLLWRIIGNQQLGVSSFFVISGFLISSILINEHRKSDTISLKRFYLRRFFRIFPAFYFLLAVIAVLAFLKIIHVSLVDWFAAATFSWNYVLSTKDWWVGHSWSLSVEEQFYLLWPALLLIAGLKKAKHWAIALICLSPLIRLLNYFLFPEWRGRLSIMLHTRIDTLMFGCLLALCWDHPLLKKSLAHKHSLIVLSTMLIFLFLVSPVLTWRFAGSYMMTLGYSLEGFCIAWVLAWVIEFPETSIGKILNYPFLMKIGVLSYSLYLWQQIFLSEINSVIGIFPLNIVCVFLMAQISYSFIEKPFLAFKPK